MIPKKLKRKKKKIEYMLKEDKIKISKSKIFTQEPS